MPQKPLVVVTDYVPDLGIEQKVLADAADLKMLQTYDENLVLEQGLDADVLLLFHTIKLTEKSIGRLKKCKAIIRCGVGYDNVDYETAGRHGIVVCNVPDYGSEEVADHALLLLLATTRRLLHCDKAIRAGGWDPTLAQGAPRMRGKTLGLIGCGNIGGAMALRAKALGIRVVFYDPYKPDGLDKALGVERVYRLEELLKQSHFVSLHCPLTSETRHILNARTLGQLPKGAYVVNTARGPVVDLKALGDALDSGHIAGAGLDVVDPEPLTDERIRKHERVLLTPHVAFYSVEGYEEMRRKGAEEGRRVLLGEAVRNAINLRFLTNPRAKIPAAAPV